MFEKLKEMFKLPEGVEIHSTIGGGIVISSNGCVAMIEDPIFGPMVYFVNMGDLPKIREYNAKVRGEVNEKD